MMQFMKPDREKTIARLFSLNARGIKYDLDRMRIAVERLGNPAADYPSIHVAGTNGKGSTCAYIDSILRAAGYRVGLHTSPHIVEFEERFMLDGRPVEADAWLDVFEAMEPVIGDLNLTFFEITTLICFELFRREQVEFAVFETGMGGRLDATNVITPEASVITSLGIDHAEFLGTDLLSIAREKLGIVKHGVPLVMVRPAESTVENLAVETCNRIDAPIWFVDERQASSISADKTFFSFNTDNVVYRLPLAGRHQIVNALAAISACRTVGIDDGETLAAGVQGAILPGRFQVLSRSGKTLVFDVAHNPQAAGVLSAALADRFAGVGTTLVFGAMKDKDIRGVLEALEPAAQHMIFTQPATDRACRAADLPAFLPEPHRCTVEIVPVVSAAVETALNSSAAVVCVCGSFFTVGEAMTALAISPFDR